jgi:mannonate dehydratase
MKLAVGLRELSDENFRFIAQLGVHNVKIANWNTLMTEPNRRGVMDTAEIRKLKSWLGEYDIRPYIFLLPQGHNTQYWNARFGRSEQANREIENVCETLRVCGGEGIPVVEWTWSVPDVWGRIPGPNSAGRGGAQVSRFDENQLDRKWPEYCVEMSADEMWDNVTYFMEQVMPVAEEAGVLMAMHHHDPPTETLCGEARILKDFEGMKKLIEVVDSPANGLNICQGSVAEQADSDVLEIIRYFGERDKIHHCHFRNVKGSVPAFDESFIDDGDVDMYEAIKVYKEVGYEHCLLPDHVPTMAADPNGNASRAYAVGYIRALMHVIGEI